MGHRLIILFMLLAGLGVGEGAKASSVLPIGVAGPMTGPYAAMGEQMRNGAGQAVRDLNARGGVLGRPLSLVVGDDACEPKQAVAVANQMVTDGVALVAGHLCSSSSIPASRVYGEEGVVQVSPGSTHPRLTDEGGPLVFRVCGRDDQQGAIAAAYIAERFPGAAIAVLHDKTAYGRGLAEETQKGLVSRGVETRIYEGFTAGEKDYTALVSRLAAKGVDMLYVGGRFTEVGLIARQAVEQGYRPQIVSGDGLATSAFWKIAGPAGEGTLMTFTPDPRRNPFAAGVVERLRAAGYEPEAYTLYTYAAVEAWAAAVERAGTIDADAVSRTLRSGTFPTVLGRLGFDANGDVTAPGFVFYRWSQGRYDYAE